MILITMVNDKKRCSWCKGDVLYEAYHDTEWGVPTKDDAKLFEFLILETFQAGLSWITILRKRKNFEKAFDKFDFRKIATYSDDKIASLLSDTGIIRNKLKIKSAVTNAQAFINIQGEFGSFANYLWGFVNHQPITNKVIDYKAAPPTTELSDIISADLKKRGFKFVGSTVVYAYLQAMGVVNDHEVSCFRYAEV